MRKVLSSQDRLEKIVADILLDMETRDRLMSRRGNAMLVSGGIYQACKLYEMFSRTDLTGKCAIITSYSPNWEMSVARSPAKARRRSSASTKSTGRCSPTSSTLRRTPP